MRLSIIYFIVSMALFSCNRQKEDKYNTIAPESSIGWAYADSIRNEIRPAEIPSDTFKLADFGFKNDSTVIQKAIDRTYEHGGGTIIIPRGVYYTGPIVLKSKINLYLKEGAVLKFIPKPELYPLTYNWFNGIPCMNYSPMIYARNETDIQISGKGIIDGQGIDPVWKNMKYNERVDWELLKDLEDEDVKPINRKFGSGHSLRPNLMAFVECSRINISGVTIINAPYWVIHPVMCTDVTVKNGLIKSHGYDQIGIALESTENVLVDSMKFQSVEDGIKIFSGRVNIPKNQASRNILIQNSVFENIVYSPVIVSSNTQAGANHIFMSDLKVDTTKSVFRIYAGRNGKIHDVFLRNCQADHITNSFFLGNISRASNAIPLMYNIHFDDIQVGSCGRVFVINGHSKNPIQNVSVSNSTFTTFMGSYVKNIKNLSFSNVKENKKEYSSTYTIGNVKTSKIQLERNEDDILDSDDIQYSDLPEAIKHTLVENYPYIPVSDIDRMITSLNVIYDVNLELESSKELQLLIQGNGQIVSTELDISFADLPETVLSALKSYLKTTPVPFIINNIKKISYPDFAYFEIKGEYDQKLFAVGITDDGKKIEEKQKLITTYFSPGK
jgi:polygalacturonase